MAMKFEFSGVVHLWRVNQAIYLVSLPVELSDEIRILSDGLTNGWDSRKVEAQIGQTIWRTSIFPDSKTQMFDLPLKAEIRRKNEIQVGSSIDVAIALVDFD